MVDLVYAKISGDFLKIKGGVFVKFFFFCFNYRGELLVLTSGSAADQMRHRGSQRP
jgi:hypothetical protein